MSTVPTPWQDLFWVVLGLVAQALFALRFISQWIESERRKQSVVPVSFWYYSLAGSLVYTVYAVFRDPVLLAGLVPSVIVYVRNIMLIRNDRSRAMLVFGLVSSLTALLSGVVTYQYWIPALLQYGSGFWQGGTDLVWGVFGLTGQAVFAMRFVWQWIVSERHKRSVVPPAFWYFCLIGGVLISVYAWFRDPVILPGQLAGNVIYIRNLWLIRQAARARQPFEPDPVPVTDSRGDRLAA